MNKHFNNLLFEPFGQYERKLNDNESICIDQNIMKLFGLNEIRDLYHTRNEIMISKERRAEN